MILEYTLTFAEFVEGITPPRPVKKNPMLRGYGGYAGWLFVILSAVFLMVVVTGTQQPAQAAMSLRPALSPAQNLWVTLAPPLAMAGLLVAAVLAGAINNWRVARQSIAANTSPASKPPSQMLGFAVILPLAFFALPFFPTLAIQWNPSDGETVAIQFMPWLIGAMILKAMGRFTRWSARQRAFATQRSQHRPFQTTVDHTGVTMKNGPNQYHYAWSSFDRYHEAASVLRLITEDERILIIPKRAIPDPAIMMELRSLIQTNIAKGNFLPAEAAFPVLPIHAPSSPPTFQRTKSESGHANNSYSA